MKSQRKNIFIRQALDERACSEMQKEQAHGGKGLAAKRHKLTVKCHYSQALGTQDT